MFGIKLVLMVNAVLQLLTMHYLMIAIAEPPPQKPYNSS